VNPLSLDLRNVNSLWGGVLAETLARSGVRAAVVSPGSRSTPLAFAFARHPGIEAIPVLDERSAAFFALGLARRDLRPVVLLCTSGTAGANYFPAVIEAHEAGVPLIVITADRPPEMRACASGQTIDQHRLYGDYVRLYHELAVPEANLALLRYLRQTVAHAAERSLAPFAGPVHLNAPFRDPLVPSGDGGSTEAFGSAVDWEGFFGHLAPPRPVAAVSQIPLFPHSARGVIVAGPAVTADPLAHAAAVGEVARRLGWPVLADGLSPARNHAASVPHLVTRYDAILRSPAAAESLRPEIVLCLGEWPTSKVLRGWVEASGAPVFLVTERPDNRDALHGATRRVVVPLQAFAEGMPTAVEPGGYERLWAGREAGARAALDARIAAEGALIEPKAAWIMGHHLPARTHVSVANSMPVRDMEFVWPANDRGYRVFCNRGANGIDGTLSTALGVAHGRPGAPARLERVPHGPEVQGKPDHRPHQQPRRGDLRAPSRRPVRAGLRGVFRDPPAGGLRGALRGPRRRARPCRGLAALREAGRKPARPGDTRPRDSRRPQEGRRLAQGRVCLGGPARLIPKTFP